MTLELAGKFLPQALAELVESYLQALPWSAEQVRYMELRIKAGVYNVSFRELSRNSAYVDFIKVLVARTAQVGGRTSRQIDASLRAKKDYPLTFMLG